MQKTNSIAKDYTQYERKSLFATENMERDDGLHKIKSIIEGYTQYRSERISLIATENVSSNLQKAVYLLGLSDQYGSRLPENCNKVGNLTFGNIGAIDRINYLTREAIKKMFRVPECDARLLSGVNGLTVLLFTLLERGDILFKMSDSCGGHLAVKPIAEKLGAQIVELYYDDNYRLDLADFEKKFKEYKPKMVLLDSSYILFPYPVKEIKEIVKDQAIIVYDASHVISSIAHNKFQNPLFEGADIIHSTTHKIFWGPQKSILLFKEKNTLSDKMLSIVGDVLVSNTHLHHMFALLIAITEFNEFGDEYIDNLIDNNRYFAKCLEKRGFSIAAKELNYTQSNQIWIRFKSKEEAIEAFKKLEDLQISTNIIFLPKDEWGLRIGTNELTRLGADQLFFEQLADLFQEAIVKNADRNYLLGKSKKLAQKISYLHPKYSYDDSQEGQEIIQLLLNRIQK